MGERIKKLRKKLGLTQKEFAERLNIGRGTLANYEVGRNEPIDAVINLICREFNVNETWLRTGEGGDGAMFRQPQGREEDIRMMVERMMGGRNAGYKRRMLSVLTALDESQWDVLVDYLRQILDERPVAPDTAGQKGTDEEIEGQVELFRRSLRSEKEPDTQASFVKESGAV